MGPVQILAYRGRNLRSYWDQWSWRWLPWCGPRSFPLIKKSKEDGVFIILLLFGGRGIIFFWTKNIWKIQFLRSNLLGLAHWSPNPVIVEVIVPAKSRNGSSYLIKVNVSNVWSISYRMMRKVKKNGHTHEKWSQFQWKKKKKPTYLQKWFLPCFWESPLHCRPTCVRACRQSHHPQHLLHYKILESTNLLTMTFKDS